MRKAQKIGILIVLVSATIGFPAWCARPADPSEAPRPAATGAVRLSLDEATRLALVNNFDIQLAKYDTWISRTRQRGDESVYDTLIDILVSHEDNQAARTSTLLGTKSLENNYNLGISRKLPTGTTLGIDFDNNRSWSNSSFVTVNPSHDSSLGLTIEQEFGKNFFGVQDRGKIKVTRKEIEGAEFLSLNNIETSLAQVQKAYWDLVLQTERVTIEEKMLSQAKKLWDTNKEKIRHKLIEEPELLASEANYKERQNALGLARDQQESAANILKLLLNIDNLDSSLGATEGFDLSVALHPEADALETAFDNRRDYRAARARLAAKNIQVTIEKNNMWPEINVKATLTHNGVDDHFSKAIEKITHESNPDLYTEFTLTMPLENNEARADLQAAQFEKARAIVTLKQLERRIMVDVMDQTRHCRVMKELARNAVQIADLQNRKLRAEEKRFRSGRSDTDTIIRFQDDAAQAAWRAAEAKYRFHTSLVDLKKTEGRLLHQYWDGAI